MTATGNINSWNLGCKRIQRWQTAWSCVRLTQSGEGKVSIQEASTMNCIFHQWLKSPSFCTEVMSITFQHNINYPHFSSFDEILGWICPPGKWEIIWERLRAKEKEMATHSSVLAWRIPWTEKPGRLQSMGSHRVRHDWSDLSVAAARAKESSYIGPPSLHYLR